jgi:cephalosporin hydroxylase
MESKGMVQVAYLHAEHVSHSWHESMRAIRDHDLQTAIADGADLAEAIRSGYRIAPRPLNIRCAAGQVAHMRNYATRLFLDRTAEADWLLMIDTDMGCEPDAVHRLLEVADPAERPVVGALCFAMMRAGYDGMGGHRFTIVPTMYKIGHTQDGHPSFCYHGDYVEDAVTPVAATGAAFVLIHRGVLEKMRAAVGDHWWDMLYDHVGDIVGEDIAFCTRLLDLGVVPVVHTGVKTNHHKEIWVSDMDYRAQAALQAVTVDGSDVQAFVHVGASLATLVANEHVQGGMLKLPADLDRYAAVIEATRPQVIVETGTRTGESAQWFAEQAGCEVITIDVAPPAVPTLDVRVRYIKGDSTDPATVGWVAKRVAGRRCMVVLDSDHSAEHVAREIYAYAPMVTPGCYLVVEDTIFGYAPQAIRDLHIPGQQGSPLDAVVQCLVDSDLFSRDVAVERMSPTSHHPAGWWVRNA